MHRNTRQELHWMSPDGAMRNPNPENPIEQDVEQLTRTGTARIVQIIRAQPGDCRDYGYLALVEIDIS